MVDLVTVTENGGQISFLNSTLLLLSSIFSNISKFVLPQNVNVSSNDVMMFQHAPYIHTLAAFISNYVMLLIFAGEAAYNEKISRGIAHFVCAVYKLVYKACMFF